MKLLRDILARVLAVWTLLVFASTMFIFIWFYLICYLLPEPQKTRWHRQVSKLWMGLYLFLSGCRFKVTGKEVFDTTTNAVIVCNHNSLIDIPVSFPFLPRANKTIAKKSFSKIPIFGLIYTFGTVLVDRRDERSRKQSVDDMKKVLETGLDMLIYPEGTRNRTNEPLKSFHNGAFKLAIDTNKPIIPVVLLNTKKILPAKPAMYFTPGKIQMDILPAIYPEGHSIDSLKNKVFEIMANHYTANK
ncbi:MAG: lysophospholipid acyltransferase family protein [Sediminibacterium sp.]|jgi:1-acyl-sn-glycerol-3-phosphate acyltransferase